MYLIFRAKLYYFSCSYRFQKCYLIEMGGGQHVYIWPTYLFSIGLFYPIKVEAAEPNYLYKRFLAGQKSKKPPGLTTIQETFKPKWKPIDMTIWTLNIKYIERIYQMSNSLYSDNGMLQIFSFLIKWLWSSLKLFKTAGILEEKKNSLKFCFNSHPL